MARYTLQKWNSRLRRYSHISRMVAHQRFVFSRVIFHSIIIHFILFFLPTRFDLYGFGCCGCYSQSKAEWVARLGAVRLNAMSPWQQERHIVGMVKSPVEGSTLVLVKLNSPVIYSDHIRPVCLQTDDQNEGPYVHCQTLGWARSR